MDPNAPIPELSEAFHRFRIVVTPPHAMKPTDPWTWQVVEKATLKVHVEDVATSHGDAQAKAMTALMGMVEEELDVVEVVTKYPE